MNIIFCGRFGEKCKIKLFDGKGKFGSNSLKCNEKGWLYILMGNNVNGCNVFNVVVDRKLWIVFIKRGVCNFKDKIINVCKYNVMVVVIYDNKDSDEVV